MMAFMMTTKPFLLETSVDQVRRSRPTKARRSRHFVDRRSHHNVKRSQPSKVDLTQHATTTKTGNGNCLCNPTAVAARSMAIVPQASNQAQALHAIM